MLYTAHADSQVNSLPDPKRQRAYLIVLFVRKMKTVERTKNQYSLYDRLTVFLVSNGRYPVGFFGE